VKDLGKGIERRLEASCEDEQIAASLDQPEAIVERILDAELRGELYPYYHRLRALAPTHRTEVAGFPPGAFLLTSFANVDRVARSSIAVNDPRTVQAFDYEGTGQGAFYRVMSQAMLFLEKEAHDRVRRLVYKAFTPAAVAPLRGLTERVAHELLDAVESEGCMDLVEQYTYPLPLRAIMRMLGLPREAESAVEQWAWDFARAGDPMSATPETIARGNAGEDLISVLLAAEEDGGTLSREEVISTLILLLQAGHETTSDLLGNAMIGLFRHPQELERLRTTPGLLQQATEELLRYDTSVQMSMRLVREEIDLDGTKIPPGAIAVLGYGAANRDPAMHPDPDRLDLDRDPTHLAFSAGSYYCLGNSLARTEIQAGLSVLFQRLPALRPEGDRFVQRWTARLRGPLELRVAWD
jgi:cytochrome P450